MEATVKAVIPVMSVMLALSSSFLNSEDEGEHRITLFGADTQDSSERQWQTGNF